MCIRDRNKVAHADHLLAERLVDEGRVGEAQQCAILVLFAQADEVVLAHERLAAGVDVDMTAELLALACLLYTSCERKGIPLDPASAVSSSIDTIGTH